jgi:CheY-like chemotaxis protein
MTLAEATILLVDDEPELLEIFSVWLGRNGCTVLTAVNGAEALKVLNAQRIDALISDIRMPIMDGMTLVRRIYELQILIPSIIFVSGFGDVDVREMYSLGVESMLAKPLSRHQLLHALECSLKDRNELWTDPLPVLPTQSVELRIASLESALTDCSFAIGRGGVCFHTDTQLAEEQAVNLNIQFTKEDLRFEAQGMVRWYRAKEQRAGVEFSYLAPGSRMWVIAAMDGRARFSYIPRC